MLKKSPKVTYSIAYTIDYRGDNDDILTFLFRGVPERIVENVFGWLGRGQYLFGSVVVNTEFDDICRNGYSSRRVYAKVLAHHADILSAEDLAVLMEARFEAEVP